MLNPSLDVAALAARFASAGRVQIAEFLAPGIAEAWHAHLAARDDWLRVINAGDTVYELGRAAQAALTPEASAQLEAGVYAGARAGFQYRFCSIRVPDDPERRATSTDPLAAFATFMSEGPVQAVLHKITGAGAIRFADAQATAYHPGDFLTAHDDAVTGKARHAAYVFGLTPLWRPEWGGLLLFHDDRRVHDGFVPALNTLNLFRVPQSHSVSEVTRAAPGPRYAITGWLRG
ncbi:proline hydroxylase [Sphingomonas baiyangensis]|uniref:Proline hydroxylase n=2 Tax=Sphingomonas baiyangensis TaxID=2572576 RepID=A0A4U1L7A6_9SPHN|nr:proline hydroxylase [Sphingomonas baiyangensis]